MPRAVLHRLFSLAYFIVLARCCGRRLPSPASPVGWSVVPALPPFSLSAAIAPVSHCSRLPLLVSAGVPAPAPPLNTLSHPIHSPTGGRVPRAPPCIWTASGLRAPPPCCRSAASPVVATHTRSHAHSHTRAPRRQDRRPHTTLSSRVAGEPLRRSSCIVLRTAGALLGPLRPTLFRCLPLPSHPVHPSRPSCSAAGGGWPAAPPRLRVVVPGPAHPSPALPFRPSPVVVGRLHPRALAPLRTPGVVSSGLACPLSALTVSFLVRFFRGPSRPAVTRDVCTVHAWSRFVSSSVWFGYAAHVCFLVVPCWLSLPCPLVVTVMPSLPSPCLAALPCRGAAPPPPLPRRAGAVRGLSGPRRSSAGACTVGLARRGCVPWRPG